MKTIIIAEAGVNHNGSIETAKLLVDIAYSAGADIVKFQTFKADKLVTKIAKKANYQSLNTKDDNTTQYDMLKSLELTSSMHEELIAYCLTKGIRFLSTGFDEESVDYLVNLGISLIKIPSGEITNKPYLRHIAHKKMDVILSTGMAAMHEINDALLVLTQEGLKIDQITVLHCNTEYPTPMKDVNLLAMLTIQNSFGVKIGYSDHTLGIEIPIAAVALGATVIEKHFTSNRKLNGPDHKASLEPKELKEMVTAIRNIELAMSGNGIKGPSNSELKNMEIARKSIVAAKSIKKGEKLTSENLTVKRPGTGISPMLWDTIIDKTAIKDFNVDDLIDF